MAIKVGCAGRRLRFIKRLQSAWCPQCKEPMTKVGNMGWRCCNPDCEQCPTLKDSEVIGIEPR